MRTNQPASHRLCVRPQALRAIGRHVLKVETDYALASALGVDPATLSQAMNGRQPSPRFVAAALGVLDRPFEDLFEVVAEAATGEPTADLELEAA